MESSLLAPTSRASFLALPYLQYLYVSIVKETKIYYQLLGAFNKSIPRGYNRHMKDILRETRPSSLQIQLAKPIHRHN